MTVESYTRLVLRWRWPAIILCVLAAVAAMAGIRNLVFSTDYRIFFSAENPQLQAFDALERRYARTDNVLFLVAARDGSMFTRERLGAVAELTAAAWKLPYSTRVDSLTNFQYSHADGDDLVVEDLVGDAAALSDADLARVRSIAESDPQIDGLLVNDTGSAALVAVTFHLPEDDAAAVAEAAQAATRLADETASAHADLDIYPTGVVMLDRQFTKAAEDDQTTIYPLMGLFLFIVMLITLRSAATALAAGVIIVMSSAIGMGLAGWAGIRLTSPAAAASVLILIIAIADSIHILITTAAGIRRGLTKTDAIIECMRLNTGPVFLTSITTVIGFLSLNWSDAPPFRHFGNIAAAGTAAAWTLTMLMLPPLMSLIPQKSLARGLNPKGAATALAAYSIRHGKAILAATGLLLVIGGGALFHLRIDDSFIRYFSTDTAFRQNADHVVNELPGLMSIEYSIDSGSAGGIADPGYLKHLQDFTDWLKAEPEVGHVSSLVDIMRRLNRNMHGDDPAYDRLPDDRELAAQYLLLYEFSLPYGLDLNNQIDVDKSASRVTVALKDVSTAQIRDLKDRSEQWLNANFPSAADTEGTGVSVIFSYLTLRNVTSMMQGTGVAFLLISLCLMAALRHVKLGLLSLGINLLPVIFGFGLWALLFGVIGIYASFVAAAAMGLIVDFTVHILSKYLRARRETGASAREALAYAYSMVGVALWLSTLILLVGFSALMLSDFVPNANFGVMTAIVIAAALAADFLVLPQLVLWLDGNDKEAPDA